jgi:transcriptional regulator with XRE-family HTH domain
MRSISNRLLAARKKKGWSQRDLAEAAEVSPASVAFHETGHRSGPRTRKKIADALAVELTDAELLS